MGSITYLDKSERRHIDWPGSLRFAMWGGKSNWTRHWFSPIVHKTHFGCVKQPELRLHYSCKTSMLLSTKFTLNEMSHEFLLSHVRGTIKENYESRCTFWAIHWKWLGVPNLSLRTADLGCTITVHTWIQLKAEPIPCFLRIINWW